MSSKNGQIFRQSANELIRQQQRNEYLERELAHAQDKVALVEGMLALHQYGRPQRGWGAKEDPAAPHLAVALRKAADDADENVGRVSTGPKGKQEGLTKEDEHA